MGVKIRACDQSVCKVEYLKLDVKKLGEGMEKYKFVERTTIIKPITEEQYNTCKGHSDMI